jgi:uncharacterized delta-60 repeat protein
MKNRVLIVLLISLGAVAGVHADGMLDPSFGNGGLVTTNFDQPFSGDFALSLVVLPDGRAVAAGSARPVLEWQYMAVARYLVSGALDTSFGNGGQVMVWFQPPPGQFDMGATAYSLLLQTDGRLVLVGDVAFQVPPRLFALARLNPDGSLDPSFGTDGRVTTSFGNSVTGSAGLLQPDGRIVAVGFLGFASGTIAAARYNANGSLDLTFGIGGQLTLPQFPAFDVRDAALQPDGKILIAGAVGANFALIRLLPNGSPDPTFDGDGLVISDFGASESGSSVIVLGDGRIVLGGYREQGSAADFALVRYLPDGTVDTTFGTGGLATADSGASEIGEQLIRLPNGKLLLAGLVNDPGAQDFLLARFQPDGALDTSFGTVGFLRTGFPGGTMDECRAVAVAGPDLVLTAGAVTAGTFPPDFGLARYIATTPVELLTFAVE